MSSRKAYFFFSFASRDKEAEEADKHELIRGAGSLEKGV
jgi:hypothetical protein